MSKRNKSKYYVVWVGQNPGIYDSWQECQLQIKGFPNAKYKSFKTMAEAEEAFHQSAGDYIEKKSRVNRSVKPSLNDFKDEIIAKSISVDAACSGNPGIMEYRGVDTFSGDEIFKMGPFKGGTNNVGEFLALVHAMAYLKKINDADTVIYTDSRTAMAWLRNKRVKTTLKENAVNKDVFTLLRRAEQWVKKFSVENKIIKWDTERWGEIPADFGRK